MGVSWTKHKQRQAILLVLQCADGFWVSTKDIADRTPWEWRNVRKIMRGMAKDGLVERRQVHKNAEWRLKDGPAILPELRPGVGSEG